jgi:hypothetical protein
VSLGAEQPRFLGRTLGYTDHPGRGMPGEPQALTAAEQSGQTAEAHRRWHEQQQRAWGKARDQIIGATQEFSASAAVDPRTRSDLRAIRRTVTRVDQRYRSL